MAARKKRKTQLIPMKIGNDPALHKYDSLQAALLANANPIAMLILAGEDELLAEANAAQEIGNEPAAQAV